MKYTPEYFDAMLVKGTWDFQLIEGKRTWVCQEDMTLKIIENESTGSFKEPWTQVYLNQDSRKYEVHLACAGTTFKSLTFIHVDGGNIDVPMPRVSTIKDEQGKETRQRKFSWERESTEYKVCSIIGKYDIYENIESIAKRSGIDIVDGPSRT